MTDEAPEPVRRDVCHSDLLRALVAPQATAPAVVHPDPDQSGGIVIVDDQHPFDCDPVCSARRCTAHAVWALFWNNPSLHTPDRRKVWLACSEHREQLSAFLTVRDFLRESVLYVEAQEKRTVVI